MKKGQIHISLILLISMATGVISCNPFAPSYDKDGLTGVDFLGNPTNLDGYFRLFKNAYELRDTTLYGRLFSQDFIFSYYDSDLGQDIQWDRDTELSISYNLFQSVIQITLDWNYYTQIDTTPTEAAVIRNFNLTITEDEETVFTGTGRARLRLARKSQTDAWQANYWFDDSDF